MSSVLSAQTRHYVWFITSIIVVSSLVLSGEPAMAQPMPGQIIVDPDNPAWLKYSGGGPFFLASPGDPEDFLYRGTRNADGTRSGDQDAIIAKLAPTGANGIYMQIIRSNGGDGNSTHNPFVSNDPTMGLNDAVLDQWDSWFNAMDASGIVIYLFFYDDSASIWGTGSSVGAEERQFFTEIVNRFENHKHLIWVVAEEYAERFSAQRVSSLAEIIRQNDDHNHPIGVHKNGGLTFNEFADDPNIDQFAMQYNVTNASELHDGVVTAWNSAAGRYNINMSEATQWGTGTTARQKAWASAMGGAYVMGLGINIIDTANADLIDLGRLRLFMESTSFNEMSPRDDLAHAETNWVLAKTNQSYIVYGNVVASQLGVKALPAGTFQFLWLDPVSGATLIQSDVAVSAGDNSWNKPAGFGNEVVLYLTTNAIDIPPPPTAPLPPENLVAE